MFTRQLSVGIMSAPTISFVLEDDYTFSSRTYRGAYTATLSEGKVLFEGQLYDELCFVGGHRFTLKDVIIGVNFHWQRKEDQTFVGDLRVIAAFDHVLAAQAGLVAINCLDVEDYLLSVISSEMSASSSLELLKAHAVISRSWLLHPILNPHAHGKTEYHTLTADGTERLIKWYERDAHTLFDVCADDHCQRYQGITRQTSDNVQRAIDLTRGEVLVADDNGEVCDARFYKSCGGMTETFENCWADEHYPYLEAVRDNDECEPLDLTQETQARQWITTSPKSYCNTHDARVLSQVLNNYDQETHDFYRWQVSYTQQELSELVRQRSGIDFGTITDLIPVRRGPSARLYELQIVGEKRTMIVGKELEIRKWLSPSHLYSSAFVVDKTTDEQGTISFHLRGAGWGHGVGLCQIGAAVMADQGKSYEQILMHYFPNTTLKRL